MGLIEKGNPAVDCYAYLKGTVSEGLAAGRQRRLVVPPDLGYGDRGRRNVIPPGATLVFDVELLAIEEPK
ncbi:MAG: hypothetical protein HC852_21205 [Acaryochloridaceae cyanobacterium RU_4_10]|nr:hypothetical protein [Acaryochloridaceae cyanobacterium RU_4_10]